MAYTTPRTWVAGEYPTAAQMNANVRDNVSFLANPPACQVTNSAVQAIADNSDTLLTFNQETYDTNTMHDTVTNNSRITFTTAGLYVVSFTGNLIAGTDYNHIQIRFRLNGSSFIGGKSVQHNSGGSFVPLISHTIQWKVSATDYIECFFYQDNVANTSRDLTAHTFSAVWVGIG